MRKGFNIHVIIIFIFNLLLSACGDSGDSTVAKPVTLEKIEISSSDMSSDGQIILNQYDTSVLSAIGKYSDGSSKQLTNEVIWLSDNKAIGNFATSGAKNVFTAHSKGKLSIIAKLIIDNKDFLSRKVSVSVTDPAQITNITISTSSAINNSVQVAKGLSVSFSALASLSNGKTRDVTSFVKWESDKLDIAAFNNAIQKQSLLALKIGSLSVKASIEQNSILKESNLIQVEVIEAVLQKIEISANGIKDEIKMFGKQQAKFVATGIFSDNTAQDISSSVTWSSSEKLIADFNSLTDKSLLSALSIGQSMISASKVVEDNKIISKLVTVNILPIIETITISSKDQINGEINIAKGLHTDFIANATLSDGTTHDVTKQVDWLTSAEGQTLGAFEDPIRKNVLEVKEVGRFTVFASMDSSSALFMNSINNKLFSNNIAINVTDAQIKNLYFEMPSQQSFIMNINDEITIKAMALMTDGSTKDVTTNSTFYTSEPRVATVEGNKVKAIFTGEFKLWGSYNLNTLNSSSAVLANKTTEQPFFQIINNITGKVLPTDPNELFSIQISLQNDKIKGTPAFELPKGTLVSFNAVGLFYPPDAIPAASTEPEQPSLPTALTGAKITNDVTWHAQSISSGSEVFASFIGNKLVAEQAGQVKVWASYLGKNSPEIIFTITDPGLVRIDLSVVEHTFPINYHPAVEVIAYYDDGTAKDVSSSIDGFYSENEDIVKANFSEGKIRLEGLSIGETQIYATFQGVNTPSRNIRVFEDHITQIEFSNTTTSTHYLRAENINVLATYQNYHKKFNITDQVSWHFEKPNFTYIDNKKWVGLRRVYNPNDPKYITSKVFAKFHEMESSKIELEHYNGIFKAFSFITNFGANYSRYPIRNREIYELMASLDEQSPDYRRGRGNFNLYWYSSNPSLVMIDPNGELRAISEGVIDMAVYYRFQEATGIPNWEQPSLLSYFHKDRNELDQEGNKIKDASVAVNSEKTNNLRFHIPYQSGSELSKTIRVGDSYTASILSIYHNNNNAVYYHEHVSWEVADPTIISISNNATITGIKPGTTTVKAIYLDSPLNNHLKIIVTE